MKYPDLVGRHPTRSLVLRGKPREVDGPSSTDRRYDISNLDGQDVPATLQLYSDLGLTFAF